MEPDEVENDADVHRHGRQHAGESDEARAVREFAQVERAQRELLAGRRAPPAPFERRRFLRFAGALGVGGLLARATNVAAAAQLGALPDGTCTLTPSGIEGPFYLALNLVREDITEGRPGFPLELFLKIVDANTCLPISGAVVDVWHASAIGRYSGFASQSTLGQTFLRGIQMTPANGVVHFHTIFPGWYPGRATHIHVKVRPTPTSELTTQLYFHHSVECALAAQPIYGARGVNPTQNQADPLFTAGTLLPTRAAGSRPPTVDGQRMFLSSLTIAVA